MGEYRASLPKLFIANGLEHKAKSKRHNMEDLIETNNIIVDGLEWSDGLRRVVAPGSMQVFPRTAGCEGIFFVFSQLGSDRSPFQR